MPKSRVLVRVFLDILLPLVIRIEHGGRLRCRHRLAHFCRPILKAQGQFTCCAVQCILTARGTIIIRVLSAARQRGLVRHAGGFSANGLHAARARGAWHGGGMMRAFSACHLSAEFADGKGHRRFCGPAGAAFRFGHRGAARSGGLAEAHVKEALRARNDFAQDRGIFGAPSLDHLRPRAVLGRLIN